MKFAFACVFAFCLSCGGSEEEETATAATDDNATSGGEQTAARIEAPPGSQGPTEEWDEDSDTAQTTPPAQSPPQTQQQIADQLFGAPDAQSGTPLPPRRPMNGSASSSYRQGVAASTSGDDATARSAFERALDADPNAYQAAYNLGVLAQRQGQDNRAIDYYRRALRIQADYELAAEGIVTIHLRRGSAPDAIAFIQPLAQRYERNLHLQALFAEALVQAGRPDEAEAAARRALRRDERFVPAMIAMIKASLRRGRNELAQSILTQALAVDDSNAELHYLKGRVFLAQDGRLGDAINEFRRAVQLRPDYLEARMALGSQLLTGANYQEALTNFQAASTLAPNSVSVLLGLGNGYRATKQWQLAKQSFDAALRAQADLPQAHFNLGLMYMSSAGEFPGLDTVAGLQRAQQELTTYRSMMGPRLPRDDQSTAYLEDLGRQIEREQRRIERERAQKLREAERAARQSVRTASADGGTGG